MKTAIAAAFRSLHPDFVPFGNFVEECTESVRPFDQPETEWPVYGVNNQTGVFFSHHQAGSEFNSPYKRIRQDWFFHNPTRANVGSIGRVGDVEENAITSPEYQVWRIKHPEWLPEFIEILIQMPFFNQMVQVHRVGAVKERLYVQNLLEIPVPTCSIDKQQKIVEQWRIATVQAMNAETAANKLVLDAQSEFLGALGLRASNETKLRRSFSLPRSKIARWGVALNQPAGNLEVSQSIYPIATLSELIADLENGWSPKCLDRPAEGVEWGVLKLGAVSNGKFDSHENKGLPPSLQPQPRLEVQAGNWLISRANIARLVGACALVGDDVPRRLILCDKIFRAVWKDHQDQVALPGYLNAALKTPHLRQQIESALTGTSPTMKNISKPSLLALRLPCPPINIQRQLLKALDTARLSAEKLRDEAKILRTSAKTQLEAAMLSQGNNGESLRELLSTGLASTPANPADANYFAGLRTQVLEATGQIFDKAQQGDNP